MHMSTTGASQLELLGHNIFSVVQFQRRLYEVIFQDFGLAYRDL